MIAAANRSLRVLCALLLLALGARADEVHLVVLHTNDVHGQLLPVRATWLGTEEPPLVGGLRAVARAVRRVRAEVAAEERPGGVLVVDGGDWFQGTPEGQLDRGAAFVRLLAAVGYDALALGNHEFDHGLANVERLVTTAAPRALCANVRDAEGGARPAWMRPWRVVEVAGLRVALVGLVTPETPVISHVDTRTLLAFEPPEDALLAVLDELPSEVDLVLPVGHDGEHECRRVARALAARGDGSAGRRPRVPLIVGGHEHRAFEEGLREGATLIVQAGARAASLGRVDLWIDDETGSVREAVARLVRLEPAESSGDAAFDELCAEVEREAAAHVGAVVGELTAPLSRARGLETSPAGSWITDVMRARTGADVALHNRGGTRTSLLAGPVTRRDLFELVPFDNHLVTLTLTGSELAACFEAALGGARSGLDFSGLRVVVDVSGARPGLAEITIDGRPLDSAADYRVTTNSFLAGGGDGYEQLERGRDPESDPILLRTMLEEALRAAGAITPPADERLAVVGEDG